MATTTDTYRVLVLHNSFRPLKRPPRPTPDGRTSPFVASSTPGESMHEFWPLYEAKDYEGALAVERQALEDYPGNALAHFNIACMSSLLGRPDDALEHLAAALDGWPAYVENARKDEDFEPVRDDPRFRDLVEATEN